MTRLEELIKLVEAKDEKGIARWLCDCFGDCDGCPATDFCRRGNNGMEKWLKEEVK